MKLDKVEFDKNRFRRYYGNIGEMVAQEVLLKQGFRVWLLTPYFPRKFKRKSIRTGLFHSLSYLYRTPPNENTLRTLYKSHYEGLDKKKFDVPAWNDFLKKNIKDYESKVREIKNFFGEDKLTAFRKYMEKLGVIGKAGIPRFALITEKEKEAKHEYIYTPDLIARKNGDIYIVEIKTGEAISYLKGEKLDEVVLAKQYGFIPILITLNINVEANDFKAYEL